MEYKIISVNCYDDFSEDPDDNKKNKFTINLEKEFNELKDQGWTYKDNWQINFNGYSSEIFFLFVKDFK